MIIIGTRWVKICPAHENFSHAMIIIGTGWVKICPAHENFSHGKNVFLHVRNSLLCIKFFYRISCSYLVTDCACKYTDHACRYTDHAYRYTHHTCRCRKHYHRHKDHTVSIQVMHPYENLGCRLNIAWKKRIWYYKLNFYFPGSYMQV